MAPGGFEHHVDASSSAPSGNGGWVIVSPSIGTLTVIAGGWEHCIIRYIVTRARIGRGQDLHKRRDLDLVRWCLFSGYVPWLCVASIDHSACERGKSLGTQQQAMRRPHLQREASLDMVSVSSTPHITLFLSLSVSTLCQNSLRHHDAPALCR